MDITIFDTEVGLKELNPNPAPKDYVNSIPNINTELITFLSRGGNIQQVWEDVKRSSIEALEIKLKGKICKLADFNPVIDIFEESSIQHEIDFSGDDEIIEGLLIVCQPINNASIIFSSLKFVSDFSQEVNFNIYNTLNGSSVYNKNIQMSVGVNNHDIDFKEKLTFGAGSYFLGISFPNQCTLTTLKRPTSEEEIFYIQPSWCEVGFAPVKKNIVATTEAVLGVSCKIEYDFFELINQYVTDLSIPYKYIAGADLIRRSLLSKEASKISLVNRDEQFVLADELDKKADVFLSEIAKTMYKELKRVPTVVKPDPSTKSGNYLDSFV